MRKKWGPLIGGVLIGLVLVAMNFKYTVTPENILYKGNVVYERSSDKPLTGYVDTCFEGSDKVLSSIQYRKGIPNGKYIIYHGNGEINVKGKYKKNKQVGTWKIYNEEGKLITKIKYKDGKEVSKKNY